VRLLIATQKFPLEKLRIPLTWIFLPAGLLFLVATRAAGFESAPYELVEQIGLLLIFAAVLGLLWCSLYIGGQDRELCVTGPRNPLYLRSLLGLIGVCLAAENVILAAISACAFGRLLQSGHSGRSEAAGVVVRRAVPALRCSDPPLLSWLQRPGTEEKILVSARSFLRAMGDATWFRRRSSRSRGSRLSS